MKLYFAGSTLGGVLKIGVSKDPERRIDALTQGCPFDISLFAILSPVNAARTENHLHVLLADHRARGEWFYLSRPTAAVVRVAQASGSVEAVIEEAEKQSRSQYSAKYELGRLDIGTVQLCSFCGKGLILVPSMVIGEFAKICSECVDRCCRMLANRDADKPAYFAEHLSDSRQDDAISVLEARNGSRDF
jgi:hypothetical protein